jgi:hypothetical protein
MCCHARHPLMPRSARICLRRGADRAQRPLQKKALGTPIDRARRTLSQYRSHCSGLRYFNEQMSQSTGPSWVQQYSHERREERCWHGLSRVRRRCPHLRERAARSRAPSNSAGASRMTGAFGWPRWHVSDMRRWRRATSPRRKRPQSQPPRRVGAMPRIFGVYFGADSRRSRSYHFC